MLINGTPKEIQGGATGFYRSIKFKGKNLRGKIWLSQVKVTKIGKQTHQK